MENIKLGVKLVDGFVLTAVIILGVGITAMIQQSRLHGMQVKMATDDLPSVQNILIIKSEAVANASLMRTLLIRPMQQRNSVKIHIRGCLRQERFTVLPRKNS